ncbi:MAG TPA: hypothetical protein VN851_08635, partial [Thermoanaerobaculia bacterium]|nr:hypothetical protein [Thermoanaerobaculia bacterium]
MKIARIARIMVLGTLVSFPSTSASERRIPPAKPVALVYSVTGEASLTAPVEARRPLRLFDRLVAGSTLELNPGARLALAFVNGRRYELGGRSKATLGRA